MSSANLDWQNLRHMWHMCSFRNWPSGIDAEFSVPSESIVNIYGVTVNPFLFGWDEYSLIFANTFAREFIVFAYVCFNIVNGIMYNMRLLAIWRYMVYFSGPRGSWSVHVCCLHLKMEFCSCARGRQWCGIIHYHWWTASIKPRLLFSDAGYASWGLSLSSV